MHYQLARSKVKKIAIAIFCSTLTIVTGCAKRPEAKPPIRIGISPDFSSLIRYSARKSCGAKMVFIFAPQGLSFAP